VDRLADLYADDTHVSHPFLGDPPLRSRAEVRRHFAAVPATGRPGFHVEDVHVHETTDPEVVVAEFAYAGDGFRYRCVFVIRVRDGLIVESRDYIDHLRSARATGRLDDLLSRLG
jgi:ketosteroid isomerase-like protein